MKASALALLLSCAAVAQTQLPPGTSSSVPEAQQSIAPRADDIALQQAEDAIAAGDYQGAVTLLSRSATATQKSARLFYDLGFAQDALGHDAEAAAAYRAALERKPDDGVARVSLGLLLARSGERSAAEQELARAVKAPGLQPEVTARALRALAQMHLETSPAQAGEDLMAALKVLPETPQDATLAAEIAMAQHDDAAAGVAYQHAQQLAPADPEVALGYARLLSAQRKYAEAESALEAARTAHPENRALVAEYASQELLLGHTAQVLPLLEQLYAAQPGDPAVARLLASDYVATGEAAKANMIYSKLLAAQPEDSGIQVEWADCLIRQKRSGEAEPVLQAVVARPGVPPDLLASADGMLAFAASSNHHPEVVLTALANREALISATAPYTFLAATAHDSLHHTKQAAEQYRLFLKQAAGTFPDQEWQAQQRLQILDRNR